MVVKLIGAYLEVKGCSLLLLVPYPIEVVTWWVKCQVSGNIAFSSLPTSADAIVQN